MSKMAFDSLKVRSDARETISFKGGLEGLRHVLAAQLRDASEEMAALIHQLVDPESAGKVRKCAENRLENLMGEHRALSELKEANSDTFLALEETLDDVQQGVVAFTETLLLVAQANPENMFLQKTSIEALMSICSAVRIDEDTAQSAINFLLGVMVNQRVNTTVQERCCEVLGHFVSQFPEAGELVGHRGGIHAVLGFLIERAEDEVAQALALAVLWGLSSQSADNKLLAAASGAVEAVGFAMEKHRSVTSIQTVGNRLLGAFVLASAVHAASKRLS